MSAITTLQNATAYNASASALKGVTLEPGRDPEVSLWFVPAGTYDGTVTFQISTDDGATWFAIDGRDSSIIETPVNAVTSPAATKVYIIPVPSDCMFRALMSGGTQGSLTAYARTGSFSNW